MEHYSFMHFMNVSLASMPECLEMYDAVDILRTLDRASEIMPNYPTVASGPSMCCL